MPRFTEHTARLAAEQISEGVALSEIEETELSSLIAMCEAELRERDLIGPIYKRFFNEVAEKHI
jgi:hypothetical protein